MLILAYLTSTALNAETTIMAAYVSPQVHHVQLCKSTGPSCPPDVSLQSIMFSCVSLQVHHVLC